MTLFFSVMQATGIYGFSVMFDRSGAYLPMFEIAGGLLILAGLLAAPPVARVFAGRRHLNG